MKTLVFVGPPGSGKTTLAGNTFRSGLLAGRKIYIINDDGDGSEGTVDAGILRGIDGLDLNALTAGCIGCKDEAEFREALQQIQAAGNVDWLIVEPVGYAAGNEVPGILHSLGIHPTVICLVDVENFADNFVDGFMATQVKAASAIGLTKYGSADSLEDPKLEAVLAFIGEHNSEAQVFFMAFGAALPEWVFRHHVHHHVHDHSCGHDHGDGGDHGVYSIHFKLRPETSYADVQRVASMIPGIFRGKGIANGRQWHLVQRTWSPESEQLCDDRGPFATFYSRQSIEADDFVSIALPVEDRYAGKDTKQILRLRTVSTEQLEEAIRKRLTIFPQKALVNRFGDLVTHPEVLAVTMQLAQREGVSRTVFAEMVRGVIRYWLFAASLLQSHAWAENPGAAEWQRRLGVALGWFGWYHPIEIGTEGMICVVAARPARLMCQGLLHLTRFHSNFGKAKVQVEEIRDVMKFGLVHENMTKEEILPIMFRFVDLAAAHGRHDVAAEWHQAIVEVENFDV